MGGAFVVWVLVMLAMIMLALWLTARISTHAIGSGIPEMKTVFRSRVTLNNKYLGFRALVAKFFGLILARSKRRRRRRRRRRQRRRRRRKRRKAKKMLRNQRE